jgi:hypothetical protein
VTTFSIRPYGRPARQIGDHDQRAGGDDRIFAEADQNRAPAKRQQLREALCSEIERRMFVQGIKVPVERENLRQVGGHSGPNDQRLIHARSFRTCANARCRS